MMIGPFPWWIAVLIGLIIFSGYMSFRAIRSEMKLEHEFIKKEGQVYMDRIQDERNRRRQTNPSDEEREREQSIS
ncbi:Sporulation protein YhaL [Salinibacillus kushneri]|uniref:Sporulation protein YhaL n=1 Tax=Salinibacillus kushneri TaxID=237682 RepID=A0A1I0AW73_9BACI|nr:sporulation YhaL family protein [Salinibacillus kushneri]SES98672.1 Sporulation protein YhaL [Salinibacillus kushneri]